MSPALEALAYTAAGERRSHAVRLPAEPFDGRVHQAAMHQAVKVYLANRRQGTADTKTRGEVAGGSRKPWRQKGTGRARQGSIRAPNWPGGGTVFGPSPRSYRLGIPSQLRRLALRSALNARARERAIAVIEPLVFDVPKTQRVATLLQALGLGGRKVLLLTGGMNRNLVLSSRNLPGVSVRRYADATALDVLSSDALVIEEPALGALEPGSPAGAPGPEAKAERPARAAGRARAARFPKAAPATRGKASTKKAPAKPASERPKRKP